MEKIKINYNDIEEILGFQIDEKVKQNITKKLNELYS